LEIYRVVIQTKTGNWGEQHFYTVKAFSFVDFNISGFSP